MRTAIVIGGGPAGSAAAMLLANGGWCVTLIEQHRFPSDKVCGECLSALGAQVLQRLGMFDELAARGAVRLGRTLLHAPSGVSVEAPLPRAMWGVSRTTLDALLLDAAARAGVRVVQPARCEALTPGPHPSVRVRDLVSNAVDQFDADVVLVADGKSALLGGPAPRRTGDLGIKTHFENVDGPRDAIELFGLGGCYGGLALIEGDCWNAAFTIPAARVRRHAGDLARLFAELIEENSALGRRLRTARQLGGWLASPLPRFAVRRHWPRDVIPIGNAAAAIEPIGGEGMGVALRSAELAAEVLCASTGVQKLRNEFQKLWRLRGGACRAGGAIASNPYWSRPAARLLAAAPAPLRGAMAMMGK